MQKENDEEQSALLVALRLALREVGGLPDEVRTLSDVSAQVLVSIVVRSIRVIESFESADETSTDLKAVIEQLGAGAASRHRASAALASKLRDLGFDGEMGYNQLLYPTAESGRELLTWLVDRLPRTEEEDQTLSSSALEAGGSHWQRSASAVAGWRAQAWRLSSSREEASFSKKKRWQTWSAQENEFATERVPKNCEATPTLIELAALAQSAASAPVVNFLEEKKDDFVSKDAGGRCVLGDVAELDLRPDASLSDILTAIDEANNNTSSTTTSSALGRLAHAAIFAESRNDDQVDTKSHTKNEEVSKEASLPNIEKKETAAVRLTRDLEELQAEFSRGRQSALEFEAEREAFEGIKKTELEAKVKHLHEEGTKLEEAYTIHRRTLELMPEAAANAARLQDLCLAAEKKLADLEAEWETHRDPLTAEIEAKSSEKTKRKQRARAMVEDMKRRRADVRQMLIDLSEKDDRAARLETEYAKMPKNVNRALYTYRILDIIGSIAKQKKEIHKIIEDIRRVQKQNNKISDTLRRTEAVADERVYQEANAQKQDPAMVQSYRYLSDLRHLFETIVTTISNTGARDREARDHHTKAKQLQSRLDANNLKRILDDLNQVKAENDSLIAKLKGTSTPGK